MCLRGKTAVSVRWVSWRGSNEWLLGRRLPAVSLNELEEADSISEILFLSLGRGCSLWQLDRWEKCRLSVPECLWCWGEFRPPSFRRRSSLFLFHDPHWSGATHTPRRKCSHRPCFCSSTCFTLSAADCVPDEKKKIFALVEKLPPLSSWKDPRE